MLKKLTFFITFSFLAASFLAVCAKANGAEEIVNLMENYRFAQWEGDSLYFDEPSGTVYFKAGEKKKQSASLSFERSEADTGFYFRIDAGNGANSGGDGGFCTVSFYGEDRSLLFSSSTGMIQGFDNYSRFSLGEEASYFPIPEKTKTVEISLHAEQSGNGERINVYFRNPAFYLSGEKPLLLYENKIYMESSAGLTKVEIGVTELTRYVWIGIVFLVAMAFYIIRIWRQKYDTARIMKGTGRKIR